ncbi:MAG TPA: ROK family protein [Thermoanaerobaculia bacterium]|nr:ROK family protein [Thermoanaerobaculia bacterium]
MADPLNRFAADRRTVLTLDAGGTNLTFSAIAGNREVATPVTLPTHGDDLDLCLGQVVEGFSRVWTATGAGAAALSFAFPGPADYPAGIIGDLPNLPGFRGGVPLGPLLEERFGVPVFINNDGDLFTYGEALHGLLPEVNRALAAAGSPKRFRNLLGVTLGTGFGGGIVRGGELYAGDNSAAGEIWLMRNKLDADCFAEEGASLRAVRRTYAQTAGLPLAAAPEPKTIDAIARGQAPGDAAAAREAFRRLGEVAGDAIANALTLLDGLVVVGGGLAAAAPHFLPALVGQLNGRLKRLGGADVPRLELTAWNLEDEAERRAFLAGNTTTLAVPGSARRVLHDPLKRTGVGLSRLGTSHAVALGAYAFALAALDGAAAAG